MKKIFIFKIAVILLSFQFLISCSDEITNLTNHNVGLASGISFNKNTDLNESKFIVINPQNGEKVQPCGTTVFTEKNNPKSKSTYQSNPYCNNQIVDPSQELLNALRLTKPIEGFVLKDGEKKRAVFYVGITAIYLGSHCTTLHLSGDAFTRCVNQEQLDAF